MIVFLAMILFSANVGYWVDSSPDRLRTLRTTILVNRGSVIVASIPWLLMLSQADLAAEGSVFILAKNDFLKGVLFAVATALGIVERLSSSGNLISMERDWVVTVAAPAGEPYDLTHLNAVMRRIDLVCKLISPIAISVFISAVSSMRIGVLFTALTSLVCLPIELLSARRAWVSIAALQAPKPTPIPARLATRKGPPRAALGIRISEYFARFGLYFSTSACVPSLALAMLHYSMLTWRPTFITYLINVGYSLNSITAARAIGSVFEIGSTVLTPMGVKYAGRTLHHGHSMVASSPEEATAFIGRDGDGADEDNLDEKTLVGLQRFGLWGFSLQLANLVCLVRRRGGAVLAHGFSPDFV